MKRRLLTLCLIISLVLVNVPVAFAQEDVTQVAPDAAPLFIPQISQGFSGDTSGFTQEDDPFAGIEDEDAPAVTEVTVSELSVDAMVAAAGDFSSVLSLNRLDSPVSIDDAPSAMKIHPYLLDVEGRRQAVVRLSEPSLAESAASEASISAVDDQRAQLARVQAQQAVVVQAVQAADLDAEVLAGVQKALNAVVVEMDAAGLRAVAAHPDVISIRPVFNYEKALVETVPYIGATAVQNLGLDGRGVKVAVLDSGVDYTHANLGGPGTLEAYEAAYGTDPDDPRNTTLDDLFPTDKVVDGYDFVGEFWPFGDLNPNPDPIDFEGHGTSVADIIGGINGVAPGVDLYAVKVCSSVSTACSGVALLQAMDWVLDPNGDGDLSDRVDIVNMSLGVNYGMAFDDDLSFAVDHVSALGVLTVAAAGNGSDKPYVAGSPAAAPTAFSVAQTQVPSAVLPLMEIIEPGTIAGFYPAVFQPWSVSLTETVAASVQYGDGAGGNLLGCEPFAPDSLAGRIVLVDRGECNFSLKILNIGQAGGLIGIIGLVAPGDPFEGGFGGEAPITIPGFMISQANANLIKNNLDAGVIIRFDPAIGIPLVGHMVGSSSRGPSMNTNIIKPEIGAPGASVSAVAGSGDGEISFGGTSGATPMISGATALLRQAYPDRSPAELKALLMNTAETQIFNQPVELGGDLAPIARIGGGEVRVARALDAPAAAWDASTGVGALSFGFYDITRRQFTAQRMVTVRNYTDSPIHYQITPSFRFADDAENGAVSLSLPDQITVPPYQDVQFRVELRIQGEQLRPWAMNSGALGADPAPLTLLEYDGYIHLDEAGNPNGSLHLAWHVLPRQAGDVTLRSAMGLVKLANRGVGTTVVESYSLIGTSPNLPQGGAGERNPTPDLRYLGYATYPVPAGFCSDEPSFVLAFAMNTWERQTHAIAPNSFEVYLDTNQDGADDYLVINRDVTLTGFTDGRNLTWVVDLATGSANAFFFTEHETNSSNTVLLLCGEQVGMNAANFGQPMDVAAYTTDYYFGGDGDEITGITIAPLGERYLGLFEQGDIGLTALSPKGVDILQVFDTGSTVNNTETGLLLLYRGGAPEGQEAGIVVVAP